MGEDKKKSGNKHYLVTQSQEETIKALPQCSIINTGRKEKKTKNVTLLSSSSSSYMLLRESVEEKHSHKIQTSSPDIIRLEIITRSEPHTMVMVLGVEIG